MALRSLMIFVRSVLHARVLLPASTAAVALVALVPAEVSADSPTCGGALPPPKPDGSAWQCTFDDEFDATALDTSTWTPQLTPQSGFSSGPVGSQVCYFNDPSVISESGGYLRLSVVQEPAPFRCGNQLLGFSTQYVGGSVSTYNSFTQTYGWFEVRAQLPQTTAHGLQETLWLYPRQLTYGAWPASGEIDFAEFYSQYYDHNIPYLHYLYDRTTTNAATSTNTVTAYDCTIDYTAFNTYGVEWEPGTISIYVNGKTCLVDNYLASNVAPPAPFDQPFMIALTQALGIGTNAFDPAVPPLPATTLVDYVRAWE